MYNIITLNKVTRKRLVFSCALFDELKYQTVVVLY